MNEQTEKLIRQMAEKMGYTVEHMWQVLVQQAQIEAFEKLGVLFAAAVFTGWVWKYASKADAKSKTLKPKSPQPEYGTGEFYRWKEDNAGYVESIKVCTGVWLCGVIVLIAFMAMVLFLGGDIISGLFNPEFWALKQLTH